VHAEPCTHGVHHKENKPYVDPDSWTQNAVHTNGSWWSGMADWLTSHSGEQVAPPSMGAAQSVGYPLEDAPGVYVYEP